MRLRSMSEIRSLRVLRLAPRTDILGRVCWRYMGCHSVHHREPFEALRYGPSDYCRRQCCGAKPALSDLLCVSTRLHALREPKEFLRPDYRAERASQIPKG